jgi:hypothetical protein
MLLEKLADINTNCWSSTMIDQDVRMRKKKANKSCRNISGSVETSSLGYGAECIRAAEQVSPVWDSRAGGLDFRRGHDPSTD